jgi:hypothetical protein
MMVEQNQQSLGDSILQIPFTQQNLTTAAYRKEVMGTLPNSILQGAGTFCGFTAEEAVQDFLNAKLVNQYGDDRYKYDLLWGRYKIEIKAQKLITSPHRNLWVRINETSLHQNPDFFIFTAVQYRNKQYRADEINAIWILGVIKPDDFYSKAEFRKKGEPSPYFDEPTLASAFYIRVYELSSITNYAEKKLNFTKQYSFNDFLK